MQLFFHKKLILKEFSRRIDHTFQIFRLFLNGLNLLKQIDTC